MDTDLLTEARALAERGWLPGIGYTATGKVSDDIRFGEAGWYTTNRVFISDRVGKHRFLLDALFHLAAHNEIVRRGWQYMPSPLLMQTYLNTLVDGSEWIIEPGTTTLSLLRCLRRACEEHERATRQAETEGKR